MVDEKKIELIKKLQALAERGERGERTAAQRQLERLMKKYNVQEADITGDVLTEHWYRYSNPLEKKLLSQVFYKIAPNRKTYRRVRGEGVKTMAGIECTAAEALQIEIEYDFYKTLWAKELDFFFRAFIQKHQIFDMSPGHLTDETMDRETARRMAMMASTMEDATLHKMITD
jgi:hypothetical protein